MARPADRAGHRTPGPATSAGQAPPDRDQESARLPALPVPAGKPSSARSPLVPENSDFFEGDAPAADRVQAFLANALEASGGSATVAGALVPWICDALLSNHSVKAYGRDFMDFVRHMQAQGVTPLEVTADHVKIYKRSLLEAGMASATVARRLSVLRGAYEQLAAKGLISWVTAQDIAAVKAPGVQKNATPSLTQKQAVALLEVIPTDSLQGMRDLAMMSVFFLTGCRVSAVTGACVGHLETDGIDHYLHVTEKRNRKRRKILLDAARPLLAYLERAGIKEDREGPLFRPLRPDGLGLVRRHLDRKTPVAAGQAVLRSRRHRPQAAGQPRHRHPFLTQDGNQRRHPQRGHHARGAGIRRARRHPHHRGLFHPQGGRRRGGGKENPDPPDRTQGRVSAQKCVTTAKTISRHDGKHMFFVVSRNHCRGASGAVGHIGRSDRSAQAIVTCPPRTGPATVHEYHGHWRPTGWDGDGTWTKSNVD